MDDYNTDSLVLDDSLANDVIDAWLCGTSVAVRTLRVRSEDGFFALESMARVGVYVALDQSAHTEI